MELKGQATIENYKTLACEVALYAFNDYVRNSIDLYCLEHPDENDFTAARYVGLVKRMKKDIIQRRMQNKLDILDTTILKIYYRELPYRKRILRSKIEKCERFFMEPAPICGLIGLDDSILANADDLIDKWLATGEAELLKTIRHEKGAFQPLEDYDD